MADQLPGPDIERLIAQYRKAQEQIIKDIMRLSSTEYISVFQYKQALLNQINAKLAALNNQSIEWVEKNIPAAYVQGLEQANAAIITQYNAAGEPLPFFPGEFAVVNQEAILSLVNGTRDAFEGLIIHTGRAADDMITTAINEIIQQKIITGQTIPQAQAAIMEALKNQGLQAFTYMRGNTPVNMQLDAYGALVARSTTAEATNQASMRQSKEVGGDLVKMTAHAPTCPICFPLQGRVYSITGKTKGYPKLEVAYSGGYAAIHPNCKHRINPYILALKSPAEIAKDKKFSNRPLDVDDMSKAEQAIYNQQLDIYNEGQKIQSKQTMNRRQWQRYQSRIGEDAPTTFSGFMRIKNSDGETWDRLQAQYRTIGRERKNGDIIEPEI